MSVSNGNTNSVEAEVPLNRADEVKDVSATSAFIPSIPTTRLIVVITFSVLLQNWVLCFNNQ